MGLLSKFLFKQKKEGVLELVEQALKRIDRMRDGFKLKLADDFRRGVGCAIFVAMDELREKEIIDAETYDAVKNRLNAWYSS